MLSSPPFTPPPLFFSPLSASEAGPGSSLEKLDIVRFVLLIERMIFC